jgi:hypothetical protein
VRHHAARTLFALSLLVPFLWVSDALLGSPTVSEPLRWTGENRALAQRTVFLAGGTSEDETLQLTAALAASGHPGIFLFDSPSSAKYSRAFLEAVEAEGMIGVGKLSSDKATIEKRYGVHFAAELSAIDSLHKALFPVAKRVVVAPADQRRLVLHAACLAGILAAPLVLASDQPDKVQLVKQQLADWKTEEVFAIGATSKVLGKLGETRVIKLNDETAVTAAYLRHQLKKGPIKTLVVANPSDVKDGLGKTSTLAPWIALQKRAALVLTNDSGKDAEEVIQATLKNEALAQAEALIFVANLQAIPMTKRPNPIKDGRDQEIEMEPMTAAAEMPCSFATGRLFHSDRNVIALMLARQRLLAKEKMPKALIVSNPGGGLPFLETFSRNTASEFKNAGYDTSAYFGREASKEAVRKQLPHQTIFLWEGHHSTLVSSYGIHQWQEPLKPSLVFLQSCMALAESKAHPFLQRGAVGVIGSSTRTYSGSGGAFALAFFDTLLYEEQSLGGSLRQAKNFMLAFAKLKERRLGEEAKLGGANVRAAWAFTLWGDPTIQMPKPPRPPQALPPVGHIVKGNTIVITLPDAVHDKVESSKFQTMMRPNARLAGLVSKQQHSDTHRLVPFVFAEVHLPRAIPGKTPTLRTKLPETHWVFCYDQRLQRGYLLVTPRNSDQGELRFQLGWE